MRLYAFENQSMLQERQELRHFHIFLQSLRSKRLNLHPPGMQNFIYKS